MKKLKELISKRFSEGITKTAIAKGMGVCGGTIYKMMETDTEHSLRILKKAAVYFGIPLTELTEETQKNQTNLIPFQDHKTDDPELTELQKKIEYIWEWVKNDQEERIYVLKTCQKFYDQYHPGLRRKGGRVTPEK